MAYSSLLNNVFLREKLLQTLKTRFLGYHRPAMLDLRKGENYSGQSVW
jgi:hypothetical protein